MFGFNENEMQEAEKLADLYDRMRKYARELDICIVTATAGVQSAPDVTDLTITWDASQRPKVLDYISLMRAKERPVAANLRLADNAWDFTMPIGYSPFRDGVRQEFNGKDDTPAKDSWLVLPQGDSEEVESLESLLEGSLSITPEEVAANPGKYAHRIYPVDLNDIHNMDVLESYPARPPEHDHMHDTPNPTQKVAVLGGRMTGRTALLLAALGAVSASESFRIEDDTPDLDANHDGDGMLRYKTKRPMSFGFGFGSQAADTAVSGAEKRQWSDRKPNGKRKKSWER